MKQDLEKYLKEQRLRLDTEEPANEPVWEGITNGLHRRKHGLPNRFWKVAAVLIFAVSLTYVVLNETRGDRMVIVTLSDVSKELGDREKELKQLVDLKWEEVQQQLPAQKTELQFLLDELDNLDEIYATYQNDLNSTLDNEPVVRALLDHYEKKIRILNRLLLEIEKQKQNEKTITL